MAGLRADASLGAGGQGPGARDRGPGTRGLCHWLCQCCLPAFPLPPSALPLCVSPVARTAQQLARPGDGKQDRPDGEKRIVQADGLPSRQTSCQPRQAEGEEHEDRQHQRVPVQRLPPIAVDQTKEAAGQAGRGTGQACQRLKERWRRPPLDEPIHVPAAVDDKQAASQRAASKHRTVVFSRPCMSPSQTGASKAGCRRARG